ncbi:MAG: DUF2177 family protein [Candidatus Spechtbacterales bacterium]|nr:DUF2177 family protein [Candidatus Spechtbacterales bacterium]
MYFKIYLIAFVIFLAIDMLWLGVIAKNFYQDQIGSLIKSDVNWTAALIFYLLFVVGVVVFAIYPGLSKGSILTAIMYGALFGFLSYATYDLTNLATLKDWPVIVTIVDMIWGAVLAASVSGLTYLVIEKFTNIRI